MNFDKYSNEVVSLDYNLSKVSIASKKGLVLISMAPSHFLETFAGVSGHLKFNPLETLQYPKLSDNLPKSRCFQLYSV